MIDYTNFISPFSWRYSSREMRSIWSEDHKRRLWRRIWLALAEVQSTFGLVTPEQVADLRANVENLAISHSLEIESQIHHDLMAELKTFAAQCPLGGGALHLGATSMDIEDNAEAIRLKESTRLIHYRLADLLAALASRIRELADLTCIAFTHLQPAEPTTYGFRLAFYAQDLLADFQELTRLLPEIRGKGFRGAVGTSAAYIDLIGIENLDFFEKYLSNCLQISFFSISSQTYPRRQEYSLLSLLASIALTLNKMAFDLRFLQSPLIGEASEPFGRSQVGSSAMPFKRNPINSEKINSLARALAHAPQLAWENAAHSLLERTLDDSANRRSLLPESFLALDELLLTETRLVKGFVLNPQAVQRNLEMFGPFAATERLLMALVKAGADRQEMHEIIRTHSLAAWQVVQTGAPNPLIESLMNQTVFRKYLSAEEIIQSLDITGYVGNAPLLARQIAADLETELQNADLYKQE